MVKEIAILQKKIFHLQRMLEIEQLLYLDQVIENQRLITLINPHGLN
jgi:hypothetical protein